MSDFRDEYQSAVQDMDMLGMKEIHIDALSVMDEGRHRMRMVKRVRRVTATTFSAVCVIFLCGFGTVKAAEYIGNVIKVSEWGFESGDALTMARNEAGGSQAFVITDEVSLDGGMSPATGGTQPMPLMQEGETEGLSEEKVSGTAGMPVGAEGTEGIEGAGGESVAVDDLQKKLDSQAVKERMSGSGMEAESMTDAVPEMVSASEDTADSVTEIPVKNYSSWEEFEKNEDMIFPQPSIDIGGTEMSPDIMVCGDWVMVRYDADGKVLWVERTDYADTQGHASSKVFPGGVCNERSYTTPQGYTYTLVDSVKEAEGGMLQIHAAVTVGSYEAFLDFMGYTEEEAERIMDSIDLSVYE